MEDIFGKYTSAWFPDGKKGWIPARVIDRQLDGDNVHLKFELNSGETKFVRIAQSDLQSGKCDGLPQLMNPAMSATSEDLSNLPHLNEPTGLSKGNTRKHKALVTRLTTL